MKGGVVLVKKLHLLGNKLLTKDAEDSDRKNEDKEEWFWLRKIYC